MRILLAMHYDLQVIEEKAQELDKVGINRTLEGDNQRDEISEHLWLFEITREMAKGISFAGSKTDCLGRSGG